MAEKIRMTDFKRGLMMALIDDDHCLVKLKAMRDAIFLKKLPLEKKLTELNDQQQELEELEVFLRSDNRSEEEYCEVSGAKLSVIE